MDSGFISHKQNKPVPGGASQNEYRQVMQTIMDSLSSKNMEAMLFLCKDYIPSGRDLSSSLEFCKYLEDRDLVSHENVLFLAEALHLVRRMDLLKLIPCIKDRRHFEEEYLSFSYYYFSNYRVLTVHLLEELTRRDFEKFHYQCKDHLNLKSLDEATNIMVLVRKLEEEDVISNDNFTELINILKCVENVTPLKKFQRLLDGDETVAMPMSKQRKKTEDIQQFHKNVFADRGVPEARSSIHRQTLPPPTMDFQVPATIENQIPFTGNQKRVTFKYDFATGNTSSKCFQSDESTPKQYKHQQMSQPNEQPPHSNLNRQFRSLPEFSGQDEYRQFSAGNSVEYVSLPPQRFSQPSYEPLPGIHHSMTYPRNMDHLPRHDHNAYMSYQNYRSRQPQRIVVPPPNYYYDQQQQPLASQMTQQHTSSKLDQDYMQPAPAHHDQGRQLPHNVVTPPNYHYDQQQQPLASQMTQQQTISKLDQDYMQHMVGHHDQGRQLPLNAPPNYYHDNQHHLPGRQISQQQTSSKLDQDYMQPAPAHHDRGRQLPRNVVLPPNYYHDQHQQPLATQMTQQQTSSKLDQDYMQQAVGHHEQGRQLSRNVVPPPNYYSDQQQQLSATQMTQQQKSFRLDDSYLQQAVDHHDQGRQLERKVVPPPNYHPDQHQQLSARQMDQHQTSSKMLQHPCLPQQHMSSTEPIQNYDLNSETAVKQMTRGLEKATLEDRENFQGQLQNETSDQVIKPVITEENNDRNLTVDEIQQEKKVEEHETLGKVLSDSYKMNSSPVGLCIIINNVGFEKNFNRKEYDRRVAINALKPKSLDLPQVDLKDRIGSDVDAEKLITLFESFDFEVHAHKDLDQRAMKKLFIELGSEDHSSYDCFLAIILSHGDTGCVFGVDSYPVMIMADIQTRFYPNECPSLQDKPKIFFIQACQGTRSMLSVSPEADLDMDGGSCPRGVYPTPVKADFLLAYATVPGHVSYRSREEGSYFIQVIVSIFEKNYEREDLLSMLIKVSDEISRYENVQVPMPIPTLRKKVFFRLKEGQDNSQQCSAESTGNLTNSSTSFSAVQVSSIAASISDTRVILSPNSSDAQQSENYPDVFKESANSGHLGEDGQESGDH